MMLNKDLYKNTNTLVLKFKDALEAIDVIKSFNCQSNFINDFQNTNENIFNQNMKIDFKSSVIGCITVLLNIVPLVICIYYGSYLVLRGYILKGDLIAIIPLVTKLSQDLSSWFNLSTETSRNLVVIESTLEILDYNFSEINTNCETTTLKECEINTFKEDDIIIDFNNVSFKYTNKYILKNITFSVRKGEKVTIVGTSGCGKSTLLKLIMKFYECNEGTIKIYKEDINNMNSVNLRKNITLLDQENYIFPITIEDNIKLRNDNASSDKLKEVVEVACIEEFIDSLPLKYKTKINESSTNISGGEKQRLSIARSLLRNSEVILMDEPTSALDIETEVKIKNQLSKFLKDKTSIIMSHNLEFIKDSNKILVLNDGVIAESEFHEELIQLNNIYYKLFNSKYKFC